MFTKIKEYGSGVLAFVREHKKKTLLIVVVALGIFYFGFKSSTGDTNQYFTVAPQELREQVAVTGRVKPYDEVSLAFEKTGRIQGAYVSVGDQVYVGTALASLDLSSALAKLKEEQSKLDQLKRGSRPEEVSVKQADVDVARQALTAEYNTSFDVVNDALAKSEDAVRVKLSGMFNGTMKSGYKLNFTTCDNDLTNTILTLRAKSEDALVALRASVSAAASATTDQDRETALSDARLQMLVFRDLLKNITALLNENCMLGDSNFDTYRTNASTANNSVATVLATLSDKINAIASAKVAVKKSESALALIKAGSDPEEIAAQEARVRDAEATVRTNQIISPLNGVVTKMDAKSGEIAYANTALITVNSKNSYKIEVQVPELDSTGIKKGDKASISFDALGTETLFPAEVALVDPAETLVDNVPTYKVTLAIQSDDARIKSGLTANVYITTAIKEGVLTVPANALTSRDGKKYVDVKEGDQTKEVLITIGAHGDKGEVEVLSGLVAGQVVVIQNADTKK
jgi:RND family efflux transporter MFP subunit